MDWISIVILALIGLLSWRAYRNGFIREAVSLAAVVLAVPIAGIFYDDLFPKVQPILDNDVAANLVSFLAIFFGVIVAGQVGSYLLRGLATALNLGPADHVAGGAFGFVEAIILAQVVLLALVTFPRPDLQDEIDGSPVATALLEAAPGLLATLPGTFDRAVDAFLSPARDIDERLGEGRTPVSGQ